MQSLSNGEPAIYTHVLSVTPAGQVMSAEELHDFAVSVLMSEYLAHGHEVSLYPKEYPNDPDLRLRSGCHDVHVLVAYHQDWRVAMRGVDTSRVWDLHVEDGIIPRLILASSWCFDAGDSGQPALAGGDFAFRFQPVSLLPLEVNAPLAEALDHDALVHLYAEMWETLSTEKIKDYLDVDLQYSTVGGFDVLPSRSEYLDYIELKFDEYRRLGLKIEVHPCWNADTQKLGLIVYLGDILGSVNFETKDGRITAISIRITLPKTQEEKDAEAAAKAEEDEEGFEQTMGARNDCIMDIDVFLQEHLQDAIQTGEPFLMAEQFQCGDEDEEPVLRKLLSIRDGGDLSYLCLLAYHEQNKNYEVVSIYPYARGVTHSVLIEEVLEFDNMVEALVRFEIDGKSVVMLATDYHAFKDLYVPGKRIRLDLAALGCEVEPAGGEEIKLEGDRAVSFLEKMGDSPSYDEDGNVKPIYLSTKATVMFINNNSAYPELAIFQSGVCDYEALSYRGHEFLKCTIVMSLAGGIRIPLYFKKEYVANEAACPESLRGILLVVGQVSEDQ